MIQTISSPLTRAHSFYLCVYLVKFSIKFNIPLYVLVTLGRWHKRPTKKNYKKKKDIAGKEGFDVMSNESPKILNRLGEYGETNPSWEQIWLTYQYVNATNKTSLRYKSDHLHHATLKHQVPKERINIIKEIKRRPLFDHLLIEDKKEGASWV